MTEIRVECEPVTAGARQDVEMRMEDLLEALSRRSAVTGRHLRLIAGQSCCF